MRLNSNNNFSSATATALGCATLLLTTGCGESTTTERIPIASPPPASPEAMPPPAAKPSAVKPRTIDPGAIVVKIGPQVFTGKQLNSQVNGHMQRLQKQNPKLNPQQIVNAIENMRMRAVVDFTSKALVLNEAETQKIQINAAEVDKDIMRFAPQGMTIEQIAQARKIPVDILRDQTRKKIVSLKLVEKATGVSVDPTDKELQDFYEQNADKFQLPERIAARHILIGVQQNDPPEIKDQKKLKAETMQKELTAKPDQFADFAKKHSTGPSAPRGGDLGEFGRTQMVKPFADAAFAQELGAIGPVVQTAFGYHIIQVTKKTEAGTAPFAQVRERILGVLVKQKQQEHGPIVTAYLNSLRTKADIQYGTYLRPQPPKAPGAKPAGNS